VFLANSLPWQARSACAVVAAGHHSRFNLNVPRLGQRRRFPAGNAVDANQLAAMADFIDGEITSFRICRDAAMWKNESETGNTTAP
jgi:hypothetical protein